MPRKILLLFIIALNITGCTSQELYRNPGRPCGDPQLAELYARRLYLDRLELALLDTLIQRCRAVNPCDHPRISEIIMQPRDLTREEYLELDILSDDCDNWKAIGPPTGWSLFLLIYGGVQLVLLTMGIRAASGT